MSQPIDAPARSALANAWRTSWIVLSILLISFSSVACKKKRSRGGAAAAPSVPTCTAPTGLSYQNLQAQYPAGEPITPIVLMISGGCTPTSITIDPPLPTGLMLDPATGDISGTPSAETPATMHTVTVTNGEGSETVTISIVIGPFLPAGLTYPVGTLVLGVGVPITPLTPTLAQGGADGFEIDPPLPSGLVFDPDTGEISGTPDTETPAGDYTITATNPSGSTTVVITLEVLGIPALRGPAEFVDLNANGVADAGDRVRITYDQELSFAGMASDIPFELPVTGDLFGAGATVDLATDPHGVEVTLGTNPSLKSRQSFDPAATTENSASGLSIPAGTMSLTSALTGAVAESGINLDLAPGFVPGASIGAGERIVAGDLTGDGIVDVCLFGGVSPQIYAGDGAGAFTATESISVAGTVADVILLDIDRDGDLDLLFTGSDVTPAAFLNDGTGSFTPGPVVSGAGESTAICSGDFDRDGRPDVAVALATEVRLLFGNDTVSSFPITGASCLGAGDLDRDGATDLVIGVEGAATRIAFGEGDGNFVDAGLTLTESIRDLVIVDVDRNGTLDLMLVTTASTELLLGDGAGGFTAGASLLGADRIRVADLDADAILDVVLARADASALYWGRSGGTFERAATTWAAWSDVAIADINGDGDLDLLATTPGSGSSVLSNSLAGTWGSATWVDTGDQLGAGSTRNSIFGDIDRDGDLDMVCAQVNYASPTGAPNLIFLNDGAGNLSPAGTIGAGNTEDAAFIDLDRDGDLDLITANRVVANDIFLNDGGTFAPTSSQAWGFATSTSLAIGDVNGDGIADVALGNHGPNEIWFGNGTGGLVDSGLRLGGGYTNSIALADLDRDGDLDLIEGNSLGRHNKVWLNQLDTGTFGYLATSQVLGVFEVHGIAIGDVDRDGHLDLVLGRVASAGYGWPNQLWLGNGDGTFDASPQTFVVAGETDPISDLTLEVNLIDYDGDGDLDLLVANLGANLLYENDGTGTFGEGTPLAGGDQPSYDLDVVDIDRDGDADVIISNSDGVANQRLTNQ